MEVTMNLKQIECAITLSHTLNFRKAAELLFITQPALTYQIKSLEEEIGFQLFYRSGKGAMLTPAGEQFCFDLVKIKEDLKTAIERGKNYSSHYTSSLNISLPLRSALYYLPEIMIQFQKEFPHIALNIHYIYGNQRIENFQKNEDDILFGIKDSLSSLSQIKFHPLFNSHIYLVTRKDDPLAKLSIIRLFDLQDQTLLVGGGSPLQLQKTQRYVTQNTNIKTINSPDHLNSLTQIAAENGICLVPGFCNDHLGEFAWIPIDFDNPMECVFITHEYDQRKEVQRFIEITQSFYQKTTLPL